MFKHHVVALPKLGSRDLKATLIEWCKSAGKWVSLDDRLCIVETNKAAYEVRSDGEGLLTQLVPVGATVTVGGALAELISEMA